MLKKMLPVLALLILWIVVSYLQRPTGRLPEKTPSSAGPDRVIKEAFRNRSSGLQVRGVGTVIRILPDDAKGSRHQRFLVRLSSGHTVLVAHNIDLAPRVTALKEAEPVEFYGEYEFNPKGGVVHWTHHDPQGRHAGGWIKYKGNTYQ